MRTILTLMLVMIAIGCFAQEQAPALRILPEDIAQDSITQWPSQIGTNQFVVRWTYTEAGARKFLAFHEAHEGQKVRTVIGFPHHFTYIEIPLAPSRIVLLLTIGLIGFGLVAATGRHLKNDSA